MLQNDHCTVGRAGYFSVLCIFVQRRSDGCLDGNLVKIGSSSKGRVWQGIVEKQRIYGKQGKKSLTRFVLRFPLLSMYWHDVKAIQAGMKFWASLSVINSSAFSPAWWHVRWLIDFWTEVRTRQAHVERMQTKMTTGCLFTPREGDP